MKRLNLRLILTTAGGLALLAVVVYLVHGWQVSRHAQGLLRRAELAEDEGDLNLAIRTLGQYLKYRPADESTFTRMALLMEEATHDRPVDPNEFFAVQRTMERAIRQQPDSEELRRRAVEFYLRFGRTKDAIDHVRYMTRQPGGGEDVELQLMLARCLIGAADAPGAAAALAAIVGYDPQKKAFDADHALDAGNVDAYAFLAALKRMNLSDPAAADEIMNQAVTVNPDSWQARFARWQYLRRNYQPTSPQYEVASADLRQAFDLAPDEPDVALAVAQLEMENKNLDEAAGILDRGIRQHPDNDQFYRLRAALALQRGDEPHARAVVRQGLEQVPRSGTLLITQAEFALDDGDYDEALAAAEKLPADERFRFYKEMFQAQVLLRKGQRREATHLLVDVLPRLMPSDRLRESSAALAADRIRLGTQGYLWLAECYENLRQWDLQQDASLQAQRLNPSSLAAKFHQVRALAAMNKTEQAQREFALLKRMASQQGVQMPSLQTWETEFLAAQQRAKPLDQRDWKVVEQRFLEHLEQLDLDGPARAAAHVRLLLQQQRVDDAVARLEQAQGEFPNDPGLLKLAVQLTQLRDGPQAALAELERVEEVIGDSVDLRIHKAALVARLNNPDAESTLAALEEDVSQFSAADVDRLRRSLGALQQSLGNRAAAQRLWRQVADANPDDVEIRDSLFELARAAGDGSQMKSLADEIKAVAGAQSAAWEFVEAKRLVWAVEHDQAPPAALDTARALARQARSQRPNWYVLSLLEGDLALRAGNEDAAIEHFQAAIEQGPPLPHVLRRLVELLGKQQRFDEARDAMAQLARAGGSSSLDEGARSRAEAGAGNLEDAIELAKAAAENSDSADDHVWLGYLLSSAGRGDDAIASYRMAVELAPTNQRAALTLLRQLIVNGRREEAESEVRRIAVEMPQQDSASLLGLSYEMLGQLPMAQHHFEMALAARPKDAAALRDMAAFYLLLKNNSRARPLLDQILTLPTADEAAESHVAWARRTKARLLAATGRYGDFQSAVRLIDANRPTGGVMLAEDALLAADLAVGRRDLASLNGAIERIERAGRVRALTAAEQFALARLYERCGRWSDCEEVMTRLVGAAPDNQQVIAAWCEMKLRRDDPTNVALLLRDLPENSPSVRLLRARLLAQQGNADRAIELVRGMIPPAESETRWSAVLQLARFLEEIKLADEAEKYLRGYVKSPQGNPLLLAEFLARRGKLDEALDIGEQQLTDQNLIVVVNLGVSALAENRTALADDAPQFARVEAWLDRGLRKLPDSMELQLRRATFLEMRGEQDLAVNIYRQLLARRNLGSAERAIVSNNLAMVLALRGDCREARQYVDAAVSELGPVPELLDTRAVAAICRGDEASLTAAIEDLNAALTMLDDSVVRFHLAQALLRSGQADAARAALQTSLDQGLNVRNLHVLERPRLAALIDACGITAQSQRDLQPPPVAVR